MNLYAVCISRAIRDCHRFNPVSSDERTPILGQLCVILVLSSFGRRTLSINRVSRF